MLSKGKQVGLLTGEVDRFETLRLVLKGKQININYDDACEIGNSLIEFYQVLAEEAHDEFTS